MRKLSYALPLARLVISIAIAGSAALAAAQRYSITNLGHLLTTKGEVDYWPAMSSDGSKVIGLTWSNANGYRNFYWDGTMHDMGGIYGNPPVAVSNDGTVIPNVNPARIWTLAGGTVSLLPGDPSAGSNAINDDDVIVGRDSTIGLCYSLSSSGWSATQLSPLSGYAHSGATVIDNAGNIFGSSTVTGPGPCEATWWTLANPLSPIDIGPLYIVTSTGSFVRGSMTCASFDSTLGIARYVWTVSSTGQTFYSDSTGLTVQLPIPAGATSYTPSGMNSSGVVVGNGGNGHAYYWSPSAGQIDLGLLPGTVSSSVFVHQNPLAKPIDDAGNIVGWCSTSNGATTPFLSTPASRMTSAKLINLNTLLSNTLKSVGLTYLYQAISTNAAGDILCIASAPGNAQYIALLKPVP
ncbi:MAG: hypothetical protein ACHQ50_05865 [Fimbriimonadales bacterium]